ncbi:TonB-dependent siderophore receptor [Aurantiacibacter xanthus]|uniref:TonB-dependent siderophore receptor n=1 Tax=Aurantiacibacter xanthus TaxID=1784712 RepID=A0A3A1P8F3_9SPHN|nr:TonB-dependent siderophore receptor [Aurantiacibacter xanthus]RIV86113.1 TonB-dependent siderophore receptor [Aurantiacibacter xanthus]
MIRKIVPAILATCIVAPVYPLAAEGNSEASEGAGPSADIIVTARLANASITGSDTPLLTYPQSTRLLDEEALEKLDAQRLQDALDYAGGVSRQNDFGGLWDKYAIRGFSGDENSGPDILINRFGSNLGYNAPVDTATIERVEVLKGASAALSGRGEPGGSVNIVTKAPLDYYHAAVTVSYGSWNALRVTGDVGGPIDDRLSVRLIGVAEDHDSFRDHVSGERQLIAPSIAWRPAESVRLLYQAEYMRNASVLDRGIVGINGDARAMDRSTFLGEPADGRIHQKIFWQQGSAFIDLSDTVSLELGSSHRVGSLRGFGTMVDFGGRGLQPDGHTVGRDRRYHDFSWDDLSLRAELTARVELFGLEHDLRLGVDRVRHALDFQLARARGTPASPILLIDAFAPVYGQPLPTPPLGLSRTASFRSESVYVQDVARRGPLTLLLGARWNSFREDVFNRVTLRELDTDDRGVTPRAALSWQVATGLSLYASWGESLRLNPSDGNSSFDAERSHSTEAGIKVSMLGNRLTGTAAVFTMEKRNVLNPNAVDPFVRGQIGQQRSRGVEAELTYEHADDLFVTAAYTYADAEIREDQDRTLIGKPLSNVPRHNASLFAFKTLGKFGIGGGVTHVGKRAGDPFGTSYSLPAYTIARAAMSYSVNERLNIRADVENLFDTYYISSSYANVWTVPGAPRNFKVTLGYTF